VTNHADERKIAPWASGRWINNEVDVLFPLQGGRLHGHELINIDGSKALLQCIEGQPLCATIH
jgi:hypothetical protein